MCATHWMIAKAKRMNRLMLKADVVLNVIRSGTNFYLMLKTYLQT